MKILKSVLGFVSKNERTILTVVAIGTELIAIYEGLKQGPKLKEIADAIAEKKENEEEVSAKEIVKDAAVPVAKVVIPLGVSIAAQILGHKKASDTIQSITSLYMLARDGKEAYRNQIAKEHGEEELNRIDNEVVKEKIVKDESSGYVEQTIYDTGHGKQKFYDEYTGRYFLSDANYIDRVINEFNKSLIDGFDYNKCVLANEFYAELGLPRLDGLDDKAWEYANGLITHVMLSNFDDNNQLYGILRFTNKPDSIRWHY